MKAPNESANFDYRDKYKHQFQQKKIEELQECIESLEKSTYKFQLVIARNRIEFLQEYYSGKDMPLIRRNKDVLAKIKCDLHHIKTILSIVVEEECDSLTIIDTLNVELEKIEAMCEVYLNQVADSSISYDYFCNINVKLDVWLKDFHGVSLNLMKSAILDLIKNKMPHALEFLSEKFISEELGRHSTDDSIVASSMRDDCVLIEQPSEVLAYILSFLKIKDVVGLGMASRLWRLIANDNRLWRKLFKENFAYHYPALSLLEEYQEIDWQEEYKLASKNPPWPFPLNVPINNHIFQSNLWDAIKNQELNKVVEYLQNGVVVSDYALELAFQDKVSPFILEALIEISCIRSGSSSYLNNLLHSACGVNNKMAAAILISKGADVNCGFFLDNKPILGNEMRPIHLAIKNGDKILVDILIGQGARVSATKRCPLFYFLIHNQRYFNELINFEFFCEEFLNDPLMLHKLMDYSGNLNTLKFLNLLLQQPLDLEARDAAGYTALHHAVAKFVDNPQHVAVIKRLIKSGANIHTTNNEGQTLLHSFIRRGVKKPLTSHLENNEFKSVFEILLKELDLNTQDNKGETPLDLVEQNFTLLYMLYELGYIPVCFNDKANNNLLHAFAKSNYSIESKPNEKLTRLIDEGVNLNQINHLGKTPLHCAIESRHHFALWYLLENQAAIDQGCKVTNDGFMYSILSCAKNMKQLIEQIISDKNKPNVLSSFFSLNKAPSNSMLLKDAFKHASLLTTQLLINSLRGEVLTAAQKKCLANVILVSDLEFNNCCCWESERLTRGKGRMRQLPATKIVELLNVMRKFCRDETGLYDNKFLLAVNTWLENYLRNTTKPQKTSNPPNPIYRP